jgi:hypothetical protein
VPSNCLGRLAIATMVWTFTTSSPACRALNGYARAHRQGRRVAAPGSQASSILAVEEMVFRLASYEPCVGGPGRPEPRPHMVPRNGYRLTIS